jgi:outer membrane protein assembly factor BamB
VRRAAGGLLVLVAVSSALVGCSHSSGTTACGSDESVVRSADPVFGQVGASGDQRLEKLADRTSTWGLGKVVGGVGYDYGQWLSLGSSSAGLIAWTRRDPVISFLGADLKARWGLRQASVPHAWTADQDSFFQLELSAKHRLWLSSHRLSDGHRSWCAVVGTRPTRQTDPYGTAFVPGGDLLVLARGSKGSELTRLDVHSGKEKWTQPLAGIDRGDYLGDLGNGLALVGGRASYEIGDQDLPQPAGSALVAIDESSGAVRWRHDGDQVHVVGRIGETVVLQQLSAKGAELVGLGVDGKVRWSRPAAKLGSDFAAAGAMLVANTGNAFVGLSPANGHERWRTPYPKVPQYLPYGFVLAAQPLLDAHHLLIGGTTGLHALDLGTGMIRTRRLPTDGINTTFWPYQVVLADKQLAVVTNTGAVVLARAG